jgi:MFS-type transporter involved in bile tolerance (Atg22 family)
MANARACYRTIRTMISENSTPKTQARAFSFFAFSGNMGILLGPLIGTCNLSLHLSAEKVIIVSFYSTWI